MVPEPGAGEGKGAWRTAPAWAGSRRAADSTELMHPARATESPDLRQPAAPSRRAAAPLPAPPRRVYPPPHPERPPRVGGAPGASAPALGVNQGAEHDPLPASVHIWESSLPVPRELDLCVTSYARLRLQTSFPLRLQLLPVCRGGPLPVNIARLLARGPVGRGGVTSG